MVRRVREKLVVAFQILMEAGNGFGTHRAGRMGAAIAYRAMFAMTPLLIIAVAVMGSVVGNSEEARREILDTISRVAGPKITDAVATFITSAAEFNQPAAVVGGLLLLWTVSSLFLELQHDLNDIFGVPYTHLTGLAAVALKRAIGFLWAMGLGLAVLGVWLLNLAWRFLAGFLPESFEPLHTIVSLVTPLVSFIILPFLFGLIFQTLTSVKIHWRAVWLGGLFTSVLFLAAAYGIGLYFSLRPGSGAYAAAGSFFVVLLTAFLLASVFLFGAEVTRAYHERLEGQEHLPKHESVQ
ncbi:MAG: YihY/virulence factor BrkB family protein [Acidimicrobiia bacterium]